MPRAAVLKRKAFFVDEGAIRRARKALGVATDAEVVRLSIARIAEMEEFWRRSRRVLTLGSWAQTTSLPLTKLVHHRCCSGRRDDRRHTFG